MTKERFTKADPQAPPRAGGSPETPVAPVAPGGRRVEAPGANGSAPLRVVLVGASHKTAPLHLLESIALGPEEVREALPEIRRTAGLEEVFLLSTCNRTEIYGSAADGARAAERLEAWLLERAQRRAGLTGEHVFQKYDQEAVDHLFRVASGIDSMMVGETQIAGQVQDALELARRERTAGSFMTRLGSCASRALKRARTETAIGSGSVSVASASVHLARRVFGDLSRRTVLVVGAGDTGRLVAEHFREHEPRALFIANRNLDKAEALARSLGAAAVSLEGRFEVLQSADVVVCATRSPEPLFTPESVREAVRSQSSRVLLLIDVSLPRNVDPAVASVGNVFLHDMYDLRRIVEQNLSRRQKEVPAVERVIEEEVEAFFRMRFSIEAGPMIRELRESFERLGRAELERHLRHFREEDRAVAERLTRDLVNKLLHRPTVEIHAIARESEGDAGRLLWIRRLFGLDGRGDDGRGDDGRGGNEDDRNDGGGSGTP